MFSSKNQSGETYPRNLASDETFVVPDKFLSELENKILNDNTILSCRLGQCFSNSEPKLLSYHHSCYYQQITDQHYRHHGNTCSCSWYGRRDSFLLRWRTISWCCASWTSWKKGHPLLLRLLLLLLLWYIADSVKNVSPCHDDVYKWRMEGIVLVIMIFVPKVTLCAGLPDSLRCMGSLWDHNEIFGCVEGNHFATILYHICLIKKTKSLTINYIGGLEPEPLPLMDLCRRVIRQQVGHFFVFLSFDGILYFILWWYFVFWLFWFLYVFYGHLLEGYQTTGLPIFALFGILYLVLEGHNDLHNMIIWTWKHCNALSWNPPNIGSKKLE